MNWLECPYVDRDPERVGGVWCFAQTRLAVASLFEHLNDGCNVDEFLEWFPAVDATKVHGVLKFVRKSVERPAA